MQEPLEEMWEKFEARLAVMHPKLQEPRELRKPLGGDSGQGRQSDHYYGRHIAAPPNNPNRKQAWSLWIGDPEL